MSDSNMSHLVSESKICFGFFNYYLEGRLRFNNLSYRDMTGQHIIKFVQFRKKEGNDSYGGLTKQSQNSQHY